jgi:hypothetical protein
VSMRFKLPTGGDVPIDIAARRMAMTLQEFELKLDALRARGFPAPDPDTGKFDLDAIDKWRRARHPQLFPADRLTVGQGALDAKDVVRTRLTGNRGG